jgi:(2Fe-2S) ferredoxin
MYSSTGGSYAALIAGATPDLLDITSDAGGSVYAGDIGGLNPLGLVSDGSGPISVSGGVCVLQPFLVVYGSNGLIRNTNANDFSSSTGWTTGTGYANSANVAGTKIVYGAPVRGGTATPAGLFWALDAVIRMSFVGGTKLFSYDTLTQPTSILGKRTVVEVDGKFFWIGTDRFFFYNGIVQELPNQMNCNYFFDNLNYDHRNKVWGTKVTKFGEIWWFYPRGTDTECRNAIIFNYNENSWYDAVASRSAGHAVQTYVKPVWAGDEDAQDTTALPIGTVLVNSVATASGAVLTFAAVSGVSAGMKVSGDPNLPTNATVLSATGTTATLTANVLGTINAGTSLTFTSMTTAFVAGVTATGGTSGATGTVVRATATSLNLQNVLGTFNAAEVITGPSGATCKTQGASYAQTLAGVYRHETGWDKILGQSVTAIPAGFTSCNFGIAVGGPFADAPQTLDTLTRLTRVEPDFGQVGGLTVSVLGKSYAAQAYRVLDSQDCPAGTNFLTPRAQERILQLQVTSDTLGGFFQLGQTLVAMEPGDEHGSS